MDSSAEAIFFEIDRGKEKYFSIEGEHQGNARGKEEGVELIEGLPADRSWSRPYNPATAKEMEQHPKSRERPHT